MGMIAPFSEDLADFSNIVGLEEKLFISKAIHQSFIEVNENGTEAASVSGTQ